MATFVRDAFSGDPAVGQRLAQPAFPFPGAGRDDDGRGDETWAVIDVVADVTSHARRGSSEWLTGREVL